MVLTTDVTSPLCGHGASTTGMTSPVCGHGVSTTVMTSYMCDNMVLTTDVTSPLCDNMVSTTGVTSPLCVDTGHRRRVWRHLSLWFVCLFFGCLTSQQQANVSQGRICSDNLTCCHTEIEVADQTFYLTQSQYTDTGPTTPNADPTTPDAWQDSHWSANF